MCRKCLEDHERRPHNEKPFKYDNQEVTQISLGKKAVDSSSIHLIAKRPSTRSHKYFPLSFEDHRVSGKHECSMRYHWNAPSHFLTSLRVGHCRSFIALLKQARSPIDTCNDFSTWSFQSSRPFSGRYHIRRSKAAVLFLLYFVLAEPAPSFARENSINHSLSSSTTYFTLSMSLGLTTHYFCFVTFGTGWSRHSPALPTLWQWWQQAISWRVKPKLGLPGLSISLSTSTDSFSSLLQP